MIKFVVISLELALVLTKYLIKRMLKDQPTSKITLVLEVNLTLYQTYIDLKKET